MIFVLLYFVVITFNIASYVYMFCSMDGPTAVMQIRALGFNNPIAGVTGNMMETDVNHFIQCGVDIVLPKPLVVEDLEQFLLTKMPVPV